MMLALKGVKGVKPPNDLEFDDDTTELITKGLISADLLTTPAPVCVRMCPDFCAATFAHGNIITPAEIRRKFRKEKNEDKVLAYFSLDDKVQEIQDEAQKVLEQEAWYVQYSKSCRAEFASEKKKNRHVPFDELAMKKPGKGGYTLSLGENIPFTFQKPTIATVRVPDEEVMCLAFPARRPKVGAPFNTEYVKLNQEYLGDVEVGGNEEVVGDEGAGGDEGVGGDEGAGGEVEVRDDEEVLGNEDMRSDEEVGGDEVVRGEVEVRDDEEVLGDEEMLGNEEALGDEKVLGNEEALGDEEGGGYEKVGDDEGVVGNEVVRGDVEVGVDKEVNGDEEMRSDEEVASNEEMRSDEEVASNEEVRCDEEVRRKEEGGDEDEMEVDFFFAEGTADDLFPSCF